MGFEEMGFGPVMPLIVFLQLSRPLALSFSREIVDGDLLAGDAAAEGSILLDAIYA